ncbi:MAG: PEP-CTERM sorting domain-containing protein [Planctomycetota bacterium]
MTSKAKKFVLLFCVTLLFTAIGLPSVQAQTITVGFYGISTHTSAENIATGEEQLWLDVTHHAGETIATFKFYNEGLLPCSITDVYIDDDQLNSLDSLLYLIDSDDPPGGPYGDPSVDFSIGAAPGHLPDQQHADPPFVSTKQFNMDGDPPPFSNGVNPGCWLGAVYSLTDGTNIFDIEQEILAGSLRVGYHVQGFSDGDSASFVNTPEPASILLLGLGTLVFLKKRRKKP